MIRAVILCLALQGCALMPADSLVGVYFRIGPDPSKSRNLEWSNERRAPEWQCPFEGAPAIGVPAGLKCDGWPILAR